MIAETTLVQLSSKRQAAFLVSSGLPAKHSSHLGLGARHGHRRGAGCLRGERGLHRFFKEAVILLLLVLTLAVASGHSHARTRDTLPAQDMGTPQATRALLQQADASGPPVSYGNDAAMTGLPTSFGAAPASGSQTDPQCIVTVTYATSHSQDATSSFGGTFLMVPSANINMNISPWVLAWRFTSGEKITRANFTTSDKLVISDYQSLPQPVNGKVGPQSVALVSPTPLNSSGLLVTFVGLKGNATSSAALQGAGQPGAIQPGRRRLSQFAPTEGNPGPPRGPAPGPALPPVQYTLGIPADVMFNGAVCSPVISPATPTAPVLQDAEPQLASGWPEVLEVKYQPIEYVTGGGALGQGVDLFSSAYTQMQLRITNPGSDSVINLADISLQYWFDAPTPGALALAFNPEDTTNETLRFKMWCTDATPQLRNGCDSIKSSFTTGLPGVKGAQYILNLYFSDTAGVLVPSNITDNATLDHITAQYGLPAIPLVDMVISIEPERHDRQMDARADFSYLNTPLYSNETVDVGGRKLQARKLLPNPHIPAYINSSLAWGTPPKPPAVQPPAGSGSVAANTTPGMTCATNSAGAQECSVGLSYCCHLGNGSWPGTLADLSAPPPDWLFSWQKSYNATPNVSSVTPPAPLIPVPPPPAGKSKAWIAGPVAVLVAVAALAMFAVARSAWMKGGWWWKKEPPTPLLPGHDQDPLNHSPALTDDSGLPIFSSPGRMHSGAVLSRRGGPLTITLLHHLCCTRPSPYDGLPVSTLPGTSGAGSMPRGLRAFFTICGASGAGTGRQGSDQTGLPELKSDPPLDSEGHVTVHMSSLLGSGRTHTGAPGHRLLGSACTPLGPPPGLTEEDKEWLENAPLLWEYKYPTMQAFIEDASDGPLEVTSVDEASLQRTTRTSLPLEGLPQAPSTGEGSSKWPVTKAWTTRPRAGNSVGLNPLRSGVFMLGRSCITWTGTLTSATSDSLSDTFELPAGVAHLLPTPRRRTPTHQPQTSTLTHPRLVWQPTEPIDLHVDYDTEVAPYLGRCIGTGGYGRVHEARWRRRRVAVKIMTCDGPLHYQTLVKEVEMSAQFRGCPHIVNLLGACLGPAPPECGSISFGRRSMLERAPSPPLPPPPAPPSPPLPEQQQGLAEPMSQQQQQQQQQKQQHQHQQEGQEGPAAAEPPPEPLGQQYQQARQASHPASSLSRPTTPASRPATPAAPPAYDRGPSADEAHRRQFVRSRPALAQADSLDLVPKQVAMIMELAECNLYQRLHGPRQPPMSVMDVIKISHEIASGLSVLHLGGVIHRDLKPQNVLMVNGVAKIADFGISKFKDPFRSFVSVTQGGGTPQYMAPEQFIDRRVDQKCDVYALGCIMYEALSGKVPWCELSMPLAPPPAPPRSPPRRSNVQDGRLAAPASPFAAPAAAAGVQSADMHSSGGQRSASPQPQAAPTSQEATAGHGPVSASHAAVAATFGLEPAGSSGSSSAAHPTLSKPAVPSGDAPAMRPPVPGSPTPARPSARPRSPFENPNVQAMQAQLVVSSEQAGKGSGIQQQEPVPHQPQPAKLLSVFQLANTQAMHAAQTNLLAQPEARVSGSGPVSQGPNMQALQSAVQGDGGLSAQHQACEASFGAELGGQDATFQGVCLPQHGLMGKAASRSDGSHVAGTVQLHHDQEGAHELPTPNVPRPMQRIQEALVAQANGQGNAGSALQLPTAGPLPVAKTDRTTSCPCGSQLCVGCADGRNIAAAAGVALSPKQGVARAPAGPSSPAPVFDWQAVAQDDSDTGGLMAALIKSARGDGGAGKGAGGNRAAGMMAGAAMGANRAAMMIPGAGMGGIIEIFLAVAVHGLRPTIPTDAPPALRLLIQACWRENPRARPTVHEVKSRLESLMRQEEDRQVFLASHQQALRRAATTQSAASRDRHVSQAGAGQAHASAPPG